MHDSEARKRAMLDAALDAVITIDAGGRIVEVNAAVEDIFGHPPESLIGREMASVLVPPIACATRTAAGSPRRPAS